MNKISSVKRILFASSWWNDVIIRSMAKHASEYGWHLDLQMCLTGQLPETWRGNGIIALPGAENLKLTQFLGTAKSPVVLLDLNEPHLKLPRVAADSIALGQLAATHYLNCGFRSFAFYSHTWQEVDKLRCEGFSETLKQAGQACTCLSWQLKQRSKKDTWLNRQHYLRSTLSKIKEPLALFSTDDTTAVEVIEACLAEAIPIPERVAVLGTGDSEIFRSCTTVPLSSIILDFDEITRQATALLDNLMKGAPAPDKPLLIAPSGIAVRRSTDTIAARSPEVAKAIRYMFENYADPIAVPDITRFSGTSKTQLYDAFEEEMGKAPGVILTRIRIDKAKQLLRTTNTKITTIAQECGFGDHINLYRCFKRYESVSPREYRRRCSPENYELQ